MKSKRHVQTLAGAAAGADSAPALERIDGPLEFDWTSDRQVDPPFRAEWQGALLAPEAGAAGGGEEDAREGE